MGEPPGGSLLRTSLTLDTEALTFLRQLINGKALWALLFYLVRTGHLKDALLVAIESEAALNRHEELFTTFLKSWVESADRRCGDPRFYSQFTSHLFSSSLPTNLRDRLLANYNSHILHAPNVDPFKLALFKLIGRIDPHRRQVPMAIQNTEDWIWFQLAMVCVEH